MSPGRPAQAATQKPMLTCALSSPGRPVQPDCLCRTDFRRVRPPGQRPGPRKPRPPCATGGHDLKKVGCGHAHGLGNWPCSIRCTATGHRLRAAGSCTRSARPIQRLPTGSSEAAVAPMHILSKNARARPMAPNGPLHFLPKCAAQFFVDGATGLRPPL